MSDKLDEIARAVVNSHCNYIISGGRAADGTLEKSIIIALLQVQRETEERQRVHAVESAYQRGKAEGLAEAFPKVQPYEEALEQLDHEPPKPHGALPSRDAFVDFYRSFSPDEPLPSQIYDWFEANSQKRDETAKTPPENVIETPKPQGALSSDRDSRIFAANMTNERWEAFEVCMKANLGEKPIPSPLDSLEACAFRAGLRQAFIELNIKPAVQGGWPSEEEIQHACDMWICKMDEIALEPYYKRRHSVIMSAWTNAIRWFKPQTRPAPAAFEPLSDEQLENESAYFHLDHPNITSKSQMFYEGAKWMQARLLGGGK